MKIFKNPTFVTLPYTTSCYWTAFVMFVGIFFMEKKCGIYKITSPSNVSAMCSLGIKSTALSNLTNDN